MNMKEWAKETGIPYGTIYSRKVRQQLPDEECVKPIRKNKLIMWKGKERTISELAEIAGISAKAFRGRLHHGWDIEKIMTNLWPDPSVSVPATKTVSTASTKTALCEEGSMSDLIERDIAIEAVQGIDLFAILPDDDGVIRTSAVEYVLSNLPSAEMPNRTEEFTQNVPNDDLISRKAAIDALVTPRVHDVYDSYWNGRNKQHQEDIDAINALPSAQPELIEKAAYIRGFEQGRTQGMIDAQGGKK